MVRDNVGELAAQKWTVNCATAVTQKELTSTELDQGIAVARTPLIKPAGKAQIPPGKAGVRIATCQFATSQGIEAPCYYYLFLHLEYRDDAHKGQHWVTEYQAVSH